MNKTKDKINFAIDFINGTERVRLSPYDNVTYIYAHPTFKIEANFNKIDENEPELGTLDIGGVEEKYTSLYRKIVLWDFGDGTKVKGFKATHFYKKPGRYTVTCIFFNNEGEGFQNIFERVVSVKEVLPTQLSIIDPQIENEKNIFCSCPSKLCSLSSSLSVLVKNTPSIKAERLNRKNETHYEDIKNEELIHLTKYWSFLTKEETKNFNDNSILKSYFKETTEYNPQYYSLYGYFYKKDNTVAFDAYKIDFWNINANKEETLTYLYNNPNNTIDTKIKIVSNKSELPERAYPIGRKAVFDVYYKSDFLTNNDKTNISLYLDTEHLKLRDTASKYDDYVNIPPLGISFNVIENKFEEINFGLTFNGIITNINYIQNNKIDKIINNFLNYNTSLKLYLIPYVCVNDDFYIPKDKNYTFNVDNESENYFKIENDNSSFYKCFYTSFDKDKKSYNLKINIDDKLFEILLSNIIDYNDVIVPKEKYKNEDFDKLLKAYTPHSVFAETNILKEYLKNIFTNNNFFNILLTRTDNFFDDHSNIKINYLNQLISTLKLLGVDLKDYGYSNFENVNELKDFVRLLSINYTNLFGHIVRKQYDINISNIKKGINVGDKILVTDYIAIDDNGLISKIKRDNKEYKINPTSIIVHDDYSKNSVVNNFFKVKGNTIRIIDDYSDSWGWNLLLPEDIKNKNNHIDSYYSFYLLKESKNEYINNFMDEKYIPEIKDWNEEKWDQEMINCLNKIILNSIEKLDSK